MTYQFYMYAYSNEEEEENRTGISKLATWKDGKLSRSEENSLLRSTAEKLVNGIIVYGYDHRADCSRAIIQDGKVAEIKKCLIG